MLMPGRNGNSGDYRYGYNGKEQDSEMHNRPGTSYDFGARIYDSRLGKFISVDPRFRDFPYMSPYCFAANNPIRLIDENGEGPEDPPMFKPPRFSSTLKVPLAAGGVGFGGRGFGSSSAGMSLRAGGIRIPNNLPKGTPVQISSTPPINPKSGVYYHNISTNSSWFQTQGVMARSPMLTVPSAGLSTQSKSSPQGLMSQMGEALGNKAESQEKDETKKETRYIYRGGSLTDGNFTPRPGKGDLASHPKRGLSTFTTPAEAMAKSGTNKAQRLSVEQLRNSGMTVDFIGTHASIRPMTQQELQNWAATRPKLKEGGNPHVITKIVKSASRGTVKKSDL